MPRRAVPSPPQPVTGVTADARGTVPYVLYEQVGHLLRRAHQRATVIFGEGIGELHLTPLQFAALVAVNEHGTIGQNALGRATAMDPATILGVTRRLIAKGFVARATDPEDRRRHLLRLTPAGRRLIPRLLARGQAISAATLAPLSADEQQCFLELLKRIG